MNADHPGGADRRRAGKRAPAEPSAADCLAAGVAGIRHSLAVFDADGQVLLATRSLEQLLGWPVGSLRGKGLADVFGADGSTRLAPLIEDLRVGAQSQARVELRTQGPQHERDRLFVWDFSIAEGPDGCTSLLVAEAPEDAIPGDCPGIEAEQRYRTLFENSRDAIYITTRDGHFVDVNRATLDLFGYTRQELIGVTAQMLYADPQDRELFRAHIEATGSVRDYEVRLQRKDGSELFCLLTAVAERDADGVVAGYQGIIHDITGRKHAEERLRHAALHDSLTQLPNRRHFMDRLARVIERAHWRPDYRFAVLFLDLDRFKLVNDSLGHGVGDELLISIGERLTASVRPEDTVARLGGDEFAVLLYGLQSETDALVIAERVQQAVRMPFKIAEHEIFTSASIGIALGSRTYSRPEDLLRDADTAMYAAKARGKERYVVFDDAMHLHAMTLLATETALRRALDRDELVLHYQPIVELEHRNVIGFEALLRWQHPERGLLTPSEFLPVAEETGLIIPIGYWVLRAACRRMRRWQDRYPEERELTVNVNVSTKQILLADFPEQVERILEEEGIGGERLRLEITEGLMLENIEPVQRTLKRLRALGIRLCVDDFGTGYSSLSYLQDFPIDVLKIDRSFVARLDAAGGDSEMVRTIFALARNLGMGVVAEGVETEAQLRNLEQLGCQHAQGFIFSRPVMDSEAESFMVESASPPANAGR